MSSARTIVILIIAFLVGGISALKGLNVILPTWVDWVSTVLVGFETFMQGTSAIKAGRMRRAARRG